MTLFMHEFSIRLKHLSRVAICALFALAAFGCGDDRTIADAANEIDVPNGVIPMGPKFCSAARPPAPFACLSDGGGCIEYLPEAELDREVLVQECEADGDTVVEHCTTDGRPVVGACNEGDRLLFSYNVADDAQTACELDNLEWLACP